MEIKRQAQETPYSSAQNSFSSLIDEETRRQLASVGPRARKHVSEGHLTATKIPSYSGLATGTLDQDKIRQDYMQQMNARPTQSMDELGIKRLRAEEEADDEYGDTEDDEPAGEAPSVDTQTKIFRRPNSHRSVSSQTEDFEDAKFLDPRRR